MERSKALVASTIIAVTLLTGAVAYAASSGVMNGRNDNVGKLQATATQPATQPNDATASVNPAAGAATTSAAPVAKSTAVTPAAQAVNTPAPAGHDIGDDHGGHGRDGDDD